MKAARLVSMGEGSTWNMRCSASYTPILCAVNTPPSILMSYRVPTNNTLIVDGGWFYQYAADETFCRISRRYFFYGHNNIAAPSGLAFTSVTFIANTDNTDIGIDGTKTYQYKACTIDMFGRETSPTAASTATGGSASTRAVAIILSSLSADGVGARLYRTLANGSTFFFLDECNGTTYNDSIPDSQLDQTRTPAVTWTQAKIGGTETSLYPCQMIEEIVSAKSLAPLSCVYTDVFGRQKYDTGVGTTTTVGRTQLFTLNHARAMASAPIGTTGIYPDQKISDWGATAFIGYNRPFGTIGGQVAVYGIHPMFVTPMLTVPAAGTVVASQFEPLIFPGGSELVVEVGNLATAAAGVRDISIFGRLI